VRYLLDTNICIYLMRQQPPEVAARFAQLSYGEVVISAITLAELKCGVNEYEHPQDRSRIARNIDRLVSLVPCLPFDALAAEAYASLHRAAPARRRDALDRLIASHALAADCVLVTNNETDFKRYPGLKVENWVPATDA
jgi:tRNA(fMet)-specific endonuclease VapC